MVVTVICVQTSRRFSTSPALSSHVSVTTDDQGIATVSMNKAPVNSLNTELIQELAQAVTDTEKKAKVGLSRILTMNWKELGTV